MPNHITAAHIIFNADKSIRRRDAGICLCQKRPESQCACVIDVANQVHMKCTPRVCTLFAVRNIHPSIHTLLPSSETGGVRNTAGHRTSARTGTHTAI